MTASLVRGQLTESIGVTGPIPRESACEDCGGRFFVDAAGTQTDELADDQALWVRTPDGLVICVGCCHAGIVNTVTHACRVAGESRIRAVVGGFHLLNASPERLRWTLESLVKLAPASLSPCHCTGEEAVQALWRAFGETCVDAHAGTVFEF